MLAFQGRGRPQTDYVPLIPPLLNFMLSLFAAEENFVGLADRLTRPVPCEKQCLGVVLFDQCARNTQFTNYWMQFTAEQ